MPTLIEEKGRCFTQYPGRREVQTHYDNLKVSRTASVEEIKKAYKRLIFIHHPDRHPPELKDEKTKIIQLLNEAWRTLADPALRAQHDAWIAQQENRENSAFTQHDRQRERQQEERAYRDFWQKMEAEWEEEYQLQKRKEEWMHQRRKQDPDYSYQAKASEAYTAAEEIFGKGKDFVKQKGAPVMNAGKRLIVRIFKFTLGLVVLLIVIGVVRVIGREVSKTAVESVVNTPAPVISQETASNNFMRSLLSNEGEVRQKAGSSYKNKGLSLGDIFIDGHSLVYEIHYYSQSANITLNPAAFVAKTIVDNSPAYNGQNPWSIMCPHIGNYMDASTFFPADGAMIYRYINDYNNDVRVLPVSFSLICQQTAL